MSGLYHISIEEEPTFLLIFSGNKVNEAEAKLIVQKHNDFRKLIANGKVPGQPRGVNLKQLVSFTFVKKTFLIIIYIFQKYDSALAAAAQKIADSCEFAHKAVHDGNNQR